MHNIDFLKFLNLGTDDSVTVDDVTIEGDKKIITISRKPSPTFCPVCDTRMNSRGIYTRVVKHPVLQDGMKVELIIKQRKWRCPACNFYQNEKFPFVERYSHKTHITVLMILEAMKDLNRSTRSIAEQFHLSDTEVHDIFTAYVDLPRLPLPEYLSVDEVYLNINSKSRYALVLMDFVTGDIVDILHNRWSSTAENYFLSIPSEERRRVKVVISDAYKQYMDYPERFFPNAEPILDSFHLSKWLTARINSYIQNVYKKYRDKDLERLKEKNQQWNLDNKSIQWSKETILLRDYRWIILKNRDHIHYDTKMRYNSKFKMNIDTYRLESMFMALDPKFKEIRDLKEEYIQFNNSEYENSDEIEHELERLIKKYRASDIAMFRDFAALLNRYRDKIIPSFTKLEVIRANKNEIFSRLSNGPMESFNRKPKDYKRNSRGSSNFDYTRNRILWATRKNPSILGKPKSYEEIHSYRGRKRGPYKKNK